MEGRDKVLRTPISVNNTRPKRKYVRKTAVVGVPKMKLKVDPKELKKNKLEEMAKIDKDTKESEESEESESDSKEDDVTNRDNDVDEPFNNELETEVRFGSAVHQVPTDFEDFIPEKMLEETPNFACLIYGKRRTGKSVILRDLLYRTRKWYDVVYSFSQTSHLQPKLFDYIPEQNQRNGFDVSFLERVLKDQEEDVQQKLKNGLEDKIKRILFIFDDVISDNRIRNSPAYNSLHTMGRHLRTSCITLTQSVGGRDGISKVCRDNVDLTLAFFPQNQVDRESIIERYLSIQNKKIGDAILKNITFEKYCAIAVLNNKSARNYQDYVYRYKCSGKTPQFTIGTKLLERESDKYNDIHLQGHIPSKSMYKFNIDAFVSQEEANIII